MNSESVQKIHRLIKEMEIEIEILKSKIGLIREEMIKLLKEETDGYGIN